MAAVSAGFTYRFTQTAEKAEGKIVRLNAGGAHPVVQFRPVGEKVAEFSDSGFVDFAVGDSVTVLYLKDTQSPLGFQTRIDTAGVLWAEPIAFTWIGGGLLVGRLWIKRRDQSQQ